MLPAAEDTSGRAVLTLALSKPVYVDMAANLARSFLRWNAAAGIRFALCTDQPDLVPADLRERIDVIPVAPGAYGRGFSPKLHLDRLAPAARTLFLDADCLCVGSVEPLFERMGGRPVATIGYPLEEGEFFGDVAAIRERFGIPAMPWFVGGAYYLERGAESAAIYAAARELEREYDEIGLVRLRGVPNEEPLMAIAMALHGWMPIPDDGSLKAEPMTFPDDVCIDVLGGHARLVAVGGGRHPAMRHLSVAEPRVVHFHGEWVHSAIYRREAVRLRRVVAHHWPPWAAGAVTAATVTLPDAIASRGRDALRPLYRRVFGYRRVPPSIREA